MQITKPTKAEVTRELKDYIFITLGLISYALDGKSGGIIDDGTDTGSTSGRNLIGNEECRPSQCIADESVSYTHLSFNIFFSLVSSVYNSKVINFAYY